MKNLVLMFVAVAAISFASCGNKASQTEAPVDSTETTTDSVADSTMQPTDSTATDSVAGAADSTVQAQ